MKTNTCIQIYRDNEAAAQATAWLNSIDICAEFRQLALGEFGVYVEIDVELDDYKKSVAAESARLQGFLEAGRTLNYPKRCQTEDVKDMIQLPKLLKPSVVEAFRMILVLAGYGVHRSDSGYTLEVWEIDEDDQCHSK